MTNNMFVRINLEDVLANFSMWHRYHAVAVVWLSFGVIFESMCFTNYVLIVEEVPYRCADNTTKNKDASEIYNFSLIQNSTVEWCQQPCAQWVYENPHSFVAEFQLACQEWKRNLVGTAHNFGYMVGIVMVGLLSDRFGRRTAAIITGVTGACCGLAKSFVSFYWIYIVLEFLEAAIGDPYSPLYVLVLEMVATDARVNYTTITGYSLALGGILLPCIKLLVPYWRTCIRVVYGPGLLFILLIYLIDESPRWLLTKGKINVVVENIENAAKLNKIEIKENLTMLSYDKDESSSFQVVIADTFKSRSLMTRLLICIFWWNTCTFVDHGLMINSVFLTGNKYLNFALVASVRLPATYFVAYILNRFNRKKPLILSFVACAVLCAGQPFISLDHTWLALTIYMASKATSGMFFKTTYIFTSELFPTYTRNTMQALCSSLGRIGSIIATQMPLLLAYWSGMPILIFGATSLVAALVTLLVPDTGKAPLPDTVRQAEALGTRTLEGRLAKNSTVNCVNPE